MHISYKFGLFLIFILSISFYHTRAAPATPNQTYTYDDDYRDDDYDDYYDDMHSNQKPVVAKASSAPTTTKATITNSIFNFLDIPKRSNHVVEPTCPKACLCLEDYKYIDCSHGRLTQVPHDIPTTAIILDLSHNLIKEIKKTDFAHRIKLQEINLNNNLIEKLEAEMFLDLPRLQRLRLASNHLSDIDPNTFRGASDLSLLDLSNNAIALRGKESFLNQPSLLELNCRNCSWTDIYENTFKNISGLTALRIDNNDFNQKINTRAFIPLKSLIKLRVPELNQNSTEELCNLLKFIDNISFKRFEVSCYELVLGASYNDSIILVTDPPFKKPTGVDITSESTTLAAATQDTTTSATQIASHKMSSNATFTPEWANETEIAKASIGITNDGVAKQNITAATNTNEEEDNRVQISQEAINQLLIGLMIISVIGIIIGLIFRKDVGGIKTKCCRTKKPLEDKNVDSNGAAPEEIPLNSLA